MKSSSTSLLSEYVALLRKRPFDDWSPVKLTIARRKKPAKNKAPRKTSPSV